MNGTSSRGTIPAKSRAMRGPATATSGRIAHHKRTGRSMEAGKGPERANAGNRLEHRLIAILAHELRNPLASIMLASRLARPHIAGDIDEPMARHKGS